jgi:hypothetical protein
VVTNASRSQLKVGSHRVTGCEDHPSRGSFVSVSLFATVRTRRWRPARHNH